MAPDISQLKAELKAWERAFKSEHNREPSKDDMKRVPEMAEKYKLYRSLLKKQEGTSESAKSSSTTKSKAKPATATTTSTAPTKLQPPTTPPKSAAKSSTLSAIHRSRNIETHAPLLNTNNPFSPHKQKHKAQASAAGTSSRKSPPLSKPPFPELSANIFATTPTRSRIGDATSDNPFYVTPTKSRLKSKPRPSASVSSSKRPAPSSPDQPSTSPPGSQHATPTKSRMFVGGSSPSKLRALIRDTPRTKARKRLAGEDVPYTPSEKRRRLSMRRNLVSTRGPGDSFGLEYGDGGDGDGPGGDLHGGKVGNDDEDDRLFDTPVKKTSGGSKGRDFAPIFGDANGTGDAGPSSSSPPRGIFAKLMAHAPPSLKLAPPSSVSRLVAGSQRVSSSLAGAGAAKGGLSSLSSIQRQPSAVSQPAASSKRTRTETETDASASKSQHPLPTDSSTKPNPHVSNPLRLRPPSPPPAEESRYKSKNKGKWASRKKAKIDVSGGAGDDADASSDDGENEDVRFVEWKTWGPLKPSAASTASASSSAGKDKGTGAEHGDGDGDDGDGSEGRDDLQLYTQHRRHRRTLLPSSEAPRPDEAEEESHISIDLPEEMRRLLLIESPRRGIQRSEVAVVKNLLSGKGNDLISVQRKVGEVWGVGEGDEDGDGDGSGSGRDKDREDDWDSEPEGWKGMVEM